LDNSDYNIKATPELYDSFNDEFITINKEKIPLAKDLTIVLGKVLETEKKIDGLTWLRNSNENEQLQGVYIISPYDPYKIPVVLVHGLMSEPRTWGKLLNILLNNRKIREHYQFWIYAYPTGIPIPINAYRFRKSLEKMKEKYDPKGTNKQFNDMVIIGHSMGGILSRLSVQSSNRTELLENVLNAKIGEMKFTDAEKEELIDIAVWEALPFVKRVILIATPHRGSDMSLSWYSKLGAKFIKIPENIKNLSAKVIDKASRKNKQSTTYAITGVGGLSPYNKFLKESVKMPIANNVKIHSIIGDTRGDNKKNGTDGVVPYWSSHLDSANSEVIIKSDHGAHMKHKATKEIIRILNESAKRSWYE
jgi:triacylglycerol esterase/lipase EstA (alpha/beta hydrolase family)